MKIALISLHHMIHLHLRTFRRSTAEVKAHTANARQQNKLWNCTFHKIFHSHFFRVYIKTSDGAGVWCVISELEVIAGKSKSVEMKWKRIKVKYMNRHK